MSAQNSLRTEDADVFSYAQAYPSCFHCLPQDFRPINGKTWRYLHKLYKGGPTIKFKVPHGVNLNDAEEIHMFINAVSV